MFIRFSDPIFKQPRIFCQIWMKVFSYLQLFGLLNGLKEKEQVFVGVWIELYGIMRLVFVGLRYNRIF